MHTAMSLNWLEMRRLGQGGIAPRPDTRLRELARANLRLSDENAQLRQSCNDLTASAETWIRLYESALARANAAEERLRRSSGNS
jgi:hypothetical protein